MKTSNFLKLNIEQMAAYEKMKAAEAIFRAERTEEAQFAYRAANEAYSALLPSTKGGYMRGRGNLAGKRQHAEQAARTAESHRRYWSNKIAAEQKSRLTFTPSEKEG